MPPDPPTNSRLGRSFSAPHLEIPSAVSVIRMVPDNRMHEMNRKYETKRFSVETREMLPKNRKETKQRKTYRN